MILALFAVNLWRSSGTRPRYTNQAGSSSAANTSKRHNKTRQTPCTHTPQNGQFATQNESQNSHQTACQTPHPAPKHAHRDHPHSPNSHISYECIRNPNCREGIFGQFTATKYESSSDIFMASTTCHETNIIHVMCNLCNLQRSSGTRPCCTNPGREQFSCQDRQETQQDMLKAAQAHTSNMVRFQHEKHSVNAHQAAHETTHKAPKHAHRALNPTQMVTNGSIRILIFRECFFCICFSYYETCPKSAYVLRVEQALNTSK